MSPPRYPKGIAAASLDTGVPIAFGVITSDTIEQAVERAGSKAGNKGWDAAMTAIEMAKVLRNSRGNENGGSRGSTPFSSSTEPSSSQRDPYPLKDDLKIFWEIAEEADPDIRTFAEISSRVPSQKGRDRCPHTDAAEKWALLRMAAVDRNILRLATYEILHRKDIPAAVTIDEASKSPRSTLPLSRLPSSMHPRQDRKGTSFSKTAGSEAEEPSS